MSNMLKFLRIICIWICCAFCLLERIQLPVVTGAITIPFEYFEDHDQLSYELDTEQSKAKYDTRLLSEQMLMSAKSTEHYESAGSHANIVGDRVNGITNTEMDTTDDNESETDADVNDLQPHERAASCHNNGHKYTHGQKVSRLDPCEVCLCMDGEIFCWWELCTKRPTIQTNSEYPSNTQQDTSTVRINEMSSTLGTTTHPNAAAGTFQLKQQQLHASPAYSGSSSSALSSTKHGYENEHIIEYDKNNAQQQNQQQANTAANIKSWPPYTSKSGQKKKVYQQQKKHKNELKHQQQQQQQTIIHHNKHAHEHINVESLHGNPPYYVYPPSATGNKILSFPENLPSVLYHDYRTEEHQHHQHQHRQQHLKHQQKKLQLQLQQQKKQQQQLQQKKRQKQQKHKHQHLHSAWHGGGVGIHHQSPPYQHESITENAYAYLPTHEQTKVSGVGENNGYSKKNNFYSMNTDWGLVDDNENVYADIETDSDILPEPPTKKPKMTGLTTATITNTTTKISTTNTTTTADDNINVYKATMDTVEALNMNTNVADINVGVAFDVSVQANGHTQQQQYDGNREYEQEQKQEQNQSVRQQKDNYVANNEKSLKMNAPDVLSSLALTSSISLLYSTPSSTAANYVVNMATPASAMSNKMMNKIVDNNQQQQKQGEQQQQQQDIFNHESSEEDQDDAFHRWLTSTEINNNSHNHNNNNNNNSKRNVTSNDNNNNSLEEDNVTTAPNTNMFGLIGMYDINATTTTITNLPNNTNTQRRVGNMKSNKNKNNNKLDNVYFRSSYNDYSGEYNGSVVNIDILLTTADEQQQHQQKEQQQKLKADLITQPSSHSQQTTAKATTTTTTETGTVSNISSLASKTITNTTTTTNASIQTNESPERQCNVMGSLYKIGDVLPQDTGNCLQCVCIDGSANDDTPRITCSPHNCPPLVLPDLFDATGY